MIQNTAEAKTTKSNECGKQTTDILSEHNASSLLKNSLEPIRLGRCRRSKATGETHSYRAGQPILIAMETRSLGLHYAPVKGELNSVYTNCRVGNTSHGQNDL